LIRVPRPAKPLEQKRRQGNPGKRALPEGTLALRPANDLDIEPPAHFGPAARFVWERAWSAAITWLSPDSDMAIVTRACELADVTDKARERYMVTGDHKDAGALARLNDQYTKALSLLGFTPTDRSRLGLAEV
jgi:hypothetical protein